MINVGELMRDADFTRTITRVRPTTTLVVDGSAEDGMESTSYAETSIVAIVAPAKLDDLKLLPEGTRGDAVRAVWSASELRTGNGDLVMPDVLEIDGQSFQVLHVAARSTNGYYKALAVDFPAGTPTVTP